VTTTPLSTIQEIAVNNNTITIRDIGPHSSLEIAVLPGINVITGTNELGKSVAIRAVAALAGGDAKNLPIRDGQPCGMVIGFGTTLSVSMRNQRAGELRDIEPVSEKIDLGSLVDPGLKDPEAANRHRVRALLNLTGTRLTYLDFREILPADRQDEISDEFEGDDPLDLHGKIKRAMEKRARLFKEQAAIEEANAKAEFSAVKEIDFTAESDEHVLRAAHQIAVEEKSRIEATIAASWNAKSAYDQAKEKLAALGSLPDLTAAQAEFDRRKEVKATSEAKERTLTAEIERLQESLKVAVAETKSAAQACEDQSTVVLHAKRAAESVAGLTEVVERGLPKDVPTQDELQASIAKVREAENAVAAGVAIRAGAAKKKKGAEHLEAGLKAGLVEEVYRHAARSTDTVLARAVSSPYFGVEGGALTAQDHKKVWRPYADLSEGGRYKTAILAMAESLEPGTLHLCTLDQAAFDGLSTKVRDLICRVAKDHNVAIVTGELSDDETLSVYQYMVSTNAAKLAVAELEDSLAT